MNISEYHLNYASVKSRGIIGLNGSCDDITYILTVHKMPVKKSGLEVVSNIKPSYDNLIYKIQYGENNTNDKDFERFASSLKRSKSNVIQLVANNPWQYFCTFTFSKEKCKEYNISRYDIQAIKKVVLQFFVNYSRRSGLELEFKYLLIPEFHKDGAVHFHGVLKGINPKDLAVNKYGYLDFVPYVERFGFCSLGAIKNLSKCANYMSKYMTKDMFLTQQMENNRHFYFASKGLKKDKVIIVGSSTCSVNDFIINGSIPYENQFENEFCIKVHTKNSNIVDYVKPFEKHYKMNVNIKKTLKGDKVTYSHHLKRWGLLAQALQRVQYQRANPVCPTVLSLVMQLLTVYPRF